MSTSSNGEDNFYHPDDIDTSDRNAATEGQFVGAHLEGSTARRNAFPPPSSQSLPYILPAPVAPNYHESNALSISVNALAKDGTRQFTYQPPPASDPNFIYDAVNYPIGEYDVLSAATRKNIVTRPGNKHYVRMLHQHASALYQSVPFEATLNGEDYLEAAYGLVWDIRRKGGRFCKVLERQGMTEAEEVMESRKALRYIIMPEDEALEKAKTGIRSVVNRLLRADRINQKAAQDPKQIKAHQRHNKKINVVMIPEGQTQPSLPTFTNQHSSAPPVASAPAQTYAQHYPSHPAHTYPPPHSYPPHMMRQQQHPEMMHQPAQGQVPTPLVGLGSVNVPTTVEIIVPERPKKRDINEKTNKMSSTNTKYSSKVANITMNPSQQEERKKEPEPQPVQPSQSVTTASVSQLARSIPPEASAVVHIFDRRVNLDAHQADASVYSLLRSWAQDDPYRFNVRATNQDLVDLEQKEAKYQQRIRQKGYASDTYTIYMNRQKDGKAVIEKPIITQNLCDAVAQTRFEPLKRNRTAESQLPRPMKFVTAPAKTPTLEELKAEMVGKAKALKRQKRDEFLKRDAAALKSLERRGIKLETY